MLYHKIAGRTILKPQTSTPRVAETESSSRPALHLLEGTAAQTTSPELTSHLLQHLWMSRLWCWHSLSFHLQAQSASSWFFTFSGFGFSSRCSIFLLRGVAGSFVQKGQTFSVKSLCPCICQLLFRRHPLALNAFSQALPDDCCLQRKSSI